MTYRGTPRAALHGVSLYFVLSALLFPENVERFGGHDEISPSAITGSSD